MFVSDENVQSTRPHQLTEEKRAFDEEERKASEEYIQRLLAEEEQFLQAERRRREDDERMARLLSDQLVRVLKSLFFLFIFFLIDVVFYVFILCFVCLSYYFFHSLAKRHLLIPVFQNSAPVTQENSRSADVTPAKKKEINAGQIER